MVYFIRSRLDVRWNLILATIVVLIVTGLLLATLFVVGQILEKEKERNSRLRDINQSLRSEVFSLQSGYLDIFNRSELSPVVAIMQWATSRGAEKLTYQDRKTLAERYTKRAQRRDLAKPDRFVVDLNAGVFSVGVGTFEGGEFTGVAHEFRFSGIDPDVLQGELKQLIADNTGAEAFEKKFVEIKTLLAQAYDSATGARDAIVDQVDQMRVMDEEVQAFVDRSHFWIVMSSVVSIIVAIFVSFLASRRLVTRPLLALRGAMQALADSDLSVEIVAQERADEIGSMARTVEVFKQNALRMRALEAEQKLNQERLGAERREALAEMTERVERETGKTVRSVVGNVSGMRDIADRMDQSSALVSSSADSVVNAAEKSLSNTQAVASATAELSS